MQTTHPAPSLDTSLLGVVRVLLMIQGGIAVLSTIEVTVAGALLGPAIAPLIILNLAAATLTLIAARGVVHRSARSRRLAIVLEWTVLLFAVIDLLLAIFLAQRGLEPVPLITRIIVPYLVIRLLRRRDVRAEFGLGPTRRHRRRDEKAAAK